ncbi:hypothetical protein D3C76_1798500 [compost metagenome]
MFRANREGKERAARAITALLREKAIGVEKYTKSNRHVAEKFVLLVEDYVPRAKKYVTAGPENI